MTLFTHTPIWVWAILLVLVIIGIKQLTQRDIKLFQPLIAPAIFAPLLILGIAQLATPLIGLVALIIGVMMGIGVGAKLFKRKPLLIASSDAGIWQQRGSFIPLVTYLYIFITRFITNALPHFPIPALPDYAPSIVVGFSGVGVGVLLSAVLFRKTIEG